MIYDSRYSKNRFAKVAGAELAILQRNIKLPPAEVRSTFSNQNAQITAGSDFLKFRCGKIARRCGGKGIFKSKCTKIRMLRERFEVQMSKNCTPLWREAHFPVKLLGNKGLFLSFQVKICNIIGSSLLKLLRMASNQLLSHKSSPKCCSRCTLAQYQKEALHASTHAIQAALR